MKKQLLFFLLTLLPMVASADAVEINNPKIGGEMAEIFSYPLQVTTSIEVEYAQKEDERESKHEEMSQ